MGVPPPSTFAEGSSVQYGFRLDLDDVSLPGLITTLFPGIGINDVLKVTRIDIQLAFGDGLAISDTIFGDDILFYRSVFSIGSPHVYADAGTYVAMATVDVQVRVDDSYAGFVSLFPVVQEGLRWTDTATVVITPVTAPIPEPETYAMLLAGLGLLGFAAQRRKQKEAALA